MQLSVDITIENDIAEAVSILEHFGGFFVLLVVSLFIYTFLNSPKSSANSML